AELAERLLNRAQAFGEAAHLLATEQRFDEFARVTQPLRPPAQQMARRVVELRETGRFACDRTLPAREPAARERREGIGRGRSGARIGGRLGGRARGRV